MKNFFAFFAVLFLSIVFGNSIAYAIDVQPLPIVAIVTLGLFAAGFGVKISGVAGSMFSNLGKTSRNNMGGLKVTLYYGLTDDILTDPQLPDQESSAVGIDTLAVLIGDILMKPGKCMFTMYGTPEEIELSSTMVGGTDAQSHKQEVSIKSPGLAAKLIGFLAATNNENMFFVVERHNGVKYKVGTPGLPAVKSDDKSGSGKKVEDGAAATMTFYSYGPGPAPIYAGSIPLTIAGSGSGSGA